MSEISPSELPPELEQEKSERKEKLKKVLELYHKLEKSMVSQQFGMASAALFEYTLMKRKFGSSTQENTPLAVSQLLFALALTQHHLLEKISDIELDQLPLKKSREKFKELVDNKVLNKIKILDLGCGPQPTFARIGRALGADIHTADILGSEDFEYADKDNVDPQIIEAEVKNHIKVDLNSEEAIKIIEDNTGGNFDLITEAHLKTGGSSKGLPYWIRACERGKKIGLPLLKQGGIYFDSHEPDRPTIKE